MVRTKKEDGLPTYMVFKKMHGLWACKKQSQYSGIIHDRHTSFCGEMTYESEFDGKWVYLEFSTYSFRLTNKLDQSHVISNLK